MGLASFNRARREQAKKLAKENGGVKSKQVQVDTGPKEGSKDWLKIQLKELGAEYPSDAKKDELQVLLDEALGA